MLTTRPNIVIATAPRRPSRRKKVGPVLNVPANVPAIVTARKAEPPYYIRRFPSDPGPPVIVQAMSPKKLAAVRRYERMRAHLDHS